MSRPRGIFLLPNPLTTAALFSGFYAIVSAVYGNFVAAAIAIFVAMVLDGLDGRVARLTQTQSEFGAQYDSLSDVIAFGVAPALVSFLWALHDLGKLGWISAFLFVACAALRLARFNTQLASMDKRFFSGLASPAAAALISAWVWVLTEQGVTGNAVRYPMAAIVAATGLLMVSNFRYYSFKDIGGRARVPFIALLIVVAVFAVASFDPALFLLLVCSAYALSGPLFSLWCWFFPGRQARLLKALAQKNSGQ